MEFRVPELGEGVYEAELVEWLVESGQTVRRGDALAEVMTDKATIQLPAPFAGTIESLAARAGESIAIGQVLLHFSETNGASGEAPVRVEATAEPAGRAVQRPRPASRVPKGGSDGNGSSRQGTLAAPSVRKMAQSLGVNLRDVPGSGPNGRVLIDDLGAFVRTHAASSTRAAQRSAPADLGKPGQRIPLQGLRRSIAQHMITAKKTIPHYSYIDECDVSHMVAMRNRLKRPLYNVHGIKLTNLPFYVKAVVGALQQVPIINSSLDDEAGEILLHNHYHIGIATATAKGLVVPVIRHADQKNLAEIAGDIERLIRAAQAGSLSRSELQGSTFTISSIGNFGGLVSTPIIHHPEVGIVAIGKIFKRPTYNDDGEIVPAQIAYLSFSFDHRVVDGSIGALFGNAMIQQLQQPETLAEGVL